MTDLRIRLEKAFKRLDIPEANTNKFIEYLETLVEWNKHIALISKREENIVNHLLAPSLLFFKFFRDDNLSIIDIGSGAGFPAIPIKIYKPSLTVTMIEPNSKKCGFLNYVCAKLGYKCNVINKRVEEIEKQLSCNVITAWALKIQPILETIKEKIAGDYLLYITSKDNHLPLKKKDEIIFKNHCAKLYFFKEQVD